MTSRIYIIAEAGVNHDGCLDTAEALIDRAADAGADCVKFQSFKAERIASAAAKKADYQIRSTGEAESQVAMLRRLELSEEAHRRLIAKCRARSIDFLSTPFDIESLYFLTGDLQQDCIKISSGEIVNAPLLIEAARRASKIILSTGMATLADVEGALAALVWGSSHHARPPASTAEMFEHYAATGPGPLGERVQLLHCTTEYPAKFSDTNLRAMETMRAAFGLRVGLSDHTPGTAISIAAAALGATVIEKHFTLDRTRPGPDHAASLEPRELNEMVAGIRAVEVALGSGRKQPAQSEIKNRPVVRKGIVAARPISAGSVIQLEDLTAKRPAAGLSPMRIYDLVGSVARKSFAPDEPVW